MDTNFTIECTWHLFLLQIDNSIQAYMFVSKIGHVSPFLFKRYWLKACIKYNFLNRNIDHLMMTLILLDVKILMVHLQRAAEMSRFGKWKNSGISPTTILPLFLSSTGNVTISKETYQLCIFFFNLELCFKLRLFPRDICWFWYWREL